MSTDTDVLSERLDEWLDLRRATKADAKVRVAALAPDDSEGTAAFAAVVEELGQIDRIIANIVGAQRYQARLAARVTALGPPPELPPKQPPRLKAHFHRAAILN